MSRFVARWFFVGAFQDCWIGFSYNKYDKNLISKQANHLQLVIVSNFFEQGHQYQYQYKDINTEN